MIWLYIDFQMPFHILYIFEKYVFVFNERKMDFNDLYGQKVLFNERHKEYSRVSFDFFFLVISWWSLKSLIFEVWSFSCLPQFFKGLRNKRDPTVWVHLFPEQKSVKDSFSTTPPLVAGNSNNNNSSNNNSSNNNSSSSEDDELLSILEEDEEEELYQEEKSKNGFSSSFSGLKTLRITIKSTSDSSSSSSSSSGLVCGLAAISPLGCPLHQEEQDARFYGRYQVNCRKKYPK